MADWSTAGEVADKQGTRSWLLKLAKGKQTPLCYFQANDRATGGPLRRSDWLPTDECADEQDRPGEDPPADWDSESEEGEPARAPPSTTARP